MNEMKNRCCVDVVDGIDGFESLNLDDERAAVERSGFPRPAIAGSGWLWSAAGGYGRLDMVAGGLGRVGEVQQLLLLAVVKDEVDCRVWQGGGLVAAVQ